MATTSVGTDRTPFQALEKYPDAAFVTDDKKLFFGNGGDTSFEYDEDGNDVLLSAGADIRLSDTQKLQFGDSGDATITWNAARLALGGTWDLAGIDVEFSDTQQLRFGNDADVTINWDAANLVIAGGGTITVSDTQVFSFGDGADIKLYYNPTSDTLILSGIPTTDPNVAGGLFISDAGGVQLRVSSAKA